STPLISLLSICLFCSGPPPVLSSFPTRRSSDLPCRSRWRRSRRRISRRLPSPRRSLRKPPSRRPTSATRRLPPRKLLTPPSRRRSEEHTSELQSRFDLVCRLLLEKKKIHYKIYT